MSYGAGRVLGGQSRDCVCTNASRGLSDGLYNTRVGWTDRQTDGFAKTTSRSAYMAC